MNETNINWLHDEEIATISTNDPRIIGQLKDLSENHPEAAKMVHRYHSAGSGEEWVAKKEFICILNEEKN